MYLHYTIRDTFSRIAISSLVHGSLILALDLLQQAQGFLFPYQSLILGACVNFSQTWTPSGNDSHLRGLTLTLEGGSPGIVLLLILQYYCTRVSPALLFVKFPDADKLHEVHFF